VNQRTAAYIGATGVDDLYGHCQRRGSAVVAPLTGHPWGLRGFVIEIPGGHRLASASVSAVPSSAVLPGERAGQSEPSGAWRVMSWGDPHSQSVTLAAVDAP